MSRKILALFANTDEENALALGEENSVIDECLRLSEYRPFELVAAHAVSVRNLRRKLLDTKAEVVHVGAHGSKTGLILADEHDDPREVPPHALADLFAAHVPPMWVAILNACYTTVSDDDLARFKAPYVVTMSDEIDDAAAIEFTRGFYDALAAGRDVEFAFQEGLRGMNAEGYTEDVAVPKLHVNQVVPAPEVRPLPQQTLFAGPSTVPASAVAPSASAPVSAPLIGLLLSVVVLGLFASPWFEPSAWFKKEGRPAIEFTGFTSNNSKLRFTLKNDSAKPVVFRNFDVVEADPEVRRRLRFGRWLFKDVPLEQGKSAIVDIGIEELIVNDGSPLTAKQRNAKVHVGADTDGDGRADVFWKFALGDLQDFVDARGSNPGVSHTSEVIQ